MGFFGAGVGLAGERFVGTEEVVGADDQFEAFVAGEQLAQHHTLLALGLVRNLDLLRSTVERDRRVRALLGFLVLLGFLSYLVLLENASNVLLIPSLRLLFVRLRTLNIVFSP